MQCLTQPLRLLTAADDNTVEVESFQGGRERVRVTDEVHAACSAIVNETDGESAVVAFVIGDDGVAWRVAVNGGLFGCWSDHEDFWFATDRRRKTVIE